MEAAFIPWSKSRNAAEKNPSLNWRVRVSYNGRAIVETDYSAGMGHCPGYSRPVSPWVADRVKLECETGKATRVNGMGFTGEPILPDPFDVIYSLTNAAGALECATFEEWAAELGYDPDSRKAEGIYRACLEIALKLRAGLGDARLTALREAFRDY